MQPITKHITIGETEVVFSFRLDKFVLEFVIYLNSPGSENIPVEKSSAPRFETWNGSRDPSETNLAWLDFLNMGQFCAIDHALF